MRGLLVSVVVLVATLARGDVSVDARRSTLTPHTPLGRRCDEALAAAQARFQQGTPSVAFHTRQQQVVGEYSWSDMCGVWGNYSVVLAPDLRPSQPWRWTTYKRRSDDSFHQRGTRRSGRWRAAFVVDSDSPGYPGDAFVAEFRPAVEVCLASAP
jgi:hypothetical protein